MVRGLYFEAKTLHIPMTSLANNLIKTGLSRETGRPTRKTPVPRGRARSRLKTSCP